MQTNSTTPRREFLGKLAGGAFGASSLLTAFDASGSVNQKLAADSDEWFKKVKGKHKIVYDVAEPYDGFGVAWSFVFYKTNNATGSPDSDLTAVVVLRHGGIPLAMEDNLWAKYKFGEMFKINDATTNAPAVRNIYATTTQPMWSQIGIQGIRELIPRGVMVCVCDVALSVFSGMVAQQTNAKPEDVKNEWVSGLIPGVQVVPSGVWAIGRAQEKGCGYCYAGG